MGEGERHVRLLSVCGVLCSVTLECPMYYPMSYVCNLLCYCCLCLKDPLENELRHLKGHPTINLNLRARSFSSKSRFLQLKEPVPSAQRAGSFNSKSRCVPRPPIRPSRPGAGVLLALSWLAGKGRLRSRPLHPALHRAVGCPVL